MGSLDYLARIGLTHRSEDIARGLRERAHARAIDAERRRASTTTAQARETACPPCQPEPSRRAHGGA